MLDAQSLVLVRLSKVSWSKILMHQERSMRKARKPLTMPVFSPLSTWSRVEPRQRKGIFQHNRDRQDTLSKRAQRSVCNCSPEGDSVTLHQCALYVHGGERGSIYLPFLPPSLSSFSPQYSRKLLNLHTLESWFYIG